jgi:hypothetical protein
MRPQTLMVTHATKVERNPDRIHAKLIEAVTRYDRKRIKRKDYNHYALAQYMMRVDDACDMIRRGISTATALRTQFNGKLLDTCLFAVGA